jgi:hypothetical protein
MIDKHWRPLTAEEKQLLKKLLAVEPELPRRLGQRLELVEAKTIDDHGCLGCLEFRSPGREEFADSSPYYQAIIDAIYADLDGVTVEVTLFVKSGNIKFLEFNKAGPILTWPDPDKLILLSPGPNKAE